MNYPVNRHNVLAGEEVDRIRKFVHQCAPHLTLNRGIEPRVVFDAGDGRVGLAQKDDSQTRPLPFVPLGGFCKVLLRLRLEDNHRDLMRSTILCFTSSQGVPPIGLSSCNFSLRSSSSRCQSGTGTASGWDAIESQMAST